MAKNNGEETKSKISFSNSIKTRLIAVMLLVTIIPLAVSIIISYVTSTGKATTDAIDALDWEAWYIESEFESVVLKNISALQAVAAAPSTQIYF